MSLRVWLPLNGDLKNIGLSGESNFAATGATVAADGKIGSCYQFTAASHAIYSNIEFSATTVSVACWIKLNTVTSTTQWVINLNNSGGGNANTLIGFYITTSGITYTAGSNNITYSTTISPNVWYHICVTWDINVGKKLYVNGELVHTNTTKGAASTATSICISGRSSNAAGTAHSFGITGGYVNDVRIYDHVLDALQVKKIAQGLMIHLPLHNNGRGLPNLLKRIPRTHDSAAYCAYQFNLTENLQAGQTYTLQLWNVDVYHSAKSAAATGVSLYWGGGSICIFSFRGPSYFYKNSDTNYRADYIKATVTITEAWAAHSNAKNAWLSVYNSPGNAEGTRHMKIGAWKLEKGTAATPYNFTTVDDEYSDFSLSTLVEYDISGYEYNGVRDEALSLSADSPVYSLSTAFDATKNNYIKIDTNKWMSQGMEEMTINVWVKPTAAFSKFFSCTESGGWNTEGGNSGYLRFPVNVYTNAEKTSVAYKYDSKELLISAIPQNEWTMVSLVYDKTGTKTYINGELHHTYSNVSYGIHYNKNARLFLGCDAATANPTTPYYTGQMSDFRIYVTALSAEEIKELYGMR